MAAELAEPQSDRPDAPYARVLGDSIGDSARGLTAPGLRAALREHELVGLTILEYLALQRHAFEVYGDHRFDDEVGDAPGWSWLPALTNGPLVGMAYYYAKPGRVEVSACKTDSKNPRKGAHAVQVVTG